MAWWPFALGGFTASLLATYLLISVMRRSGSGQPIREYGPKIHEHKRGTPTMGGAALLIAALTVVFSYQLVHGPLSAQGLLLVGSALGFGLIGLIDDALKFTQQRSQGLPGRYKLLLQLIVSMGVLLALGASGALEPSFDVPFSSVHWEGSRPLFVIVVLFVFVGTVNAWNLTDGLDGLACGITLIVLAAYGIIAAHLGSGDLLPLIVIFLAVLLGFLPFNAYPAKIFLGDTGSMALGGLVATLSVLMGTELFLIFFAFVPLVEVLSVIIQVISFKAFKKRIFKISPLHHHFERAEGIDYEYLLPAAEWPEWRITLIFWGAAVIFALVGVVGYFTPGGG